MSSGEGGVMWVQVRLGGCLGGGCSGGEGGGGCVQVGVQSGEGSKGANVRGVEGEQRGKCWGGGRAQRNLFAI